MSGARDAILERIRAATRDVPAGEAAAWPGPGPPGAPDAYERTLGIPAQARVELFAERVAEYRATVIRCAADDRAIAAALAGAAATEGARRLVVPHDLPRAWLDGGGDIAPLPDDPAAPLDLDTLDGSDGVVTGSTLGIALTGTIVLDTGPGQGRRAITLVPDLHLCVVRSDDVVGSVPEGFDGLAQARVDGRPITFVSGPSATSDIELMRVEGVHGPRRLVVVLAG
jgi:L-lactate dehydrogenase complex protein LldG